MDRRRPKLIQKYVGTYSERLEQPENRVEWVFAHEFQMLNLPQTPDLIDQLCAGPNTKVELVPASDPRRVAVCSFVQWLGSGSGQAWLKRVQARIKGIRD